MFERFNEAAGIHRRKRTGRANKANRGTACFNEAAGIHRRKHVTRWRPFFILAAASMRPPEFTGGNQQMASRYIRRAKASMRPPEFTGGNVGVSADTASFDPLQ